VSIDIALVDLEARAVVQGPFLTLDLGSTVHSGKASTPFRTQDRSTHHTPHAGRSRRAAPPRAGTHAGRESTRCRCRGGTPPHTRRRARRNTGACSGRGSHPLGTRIIRHVQCTRLAPECHRMSQRASIVLTKAACRCCMFVA
jgi:hypothetical protein